MSLLLRRMRGIVGLGLTWSLVWAVAGAVVGGVAGYTLLRNYAEPAAGTLARMALASSLSWASYGFVLGGLFAGVLAIAERRRSLEQLAIWRIAIWGGLAGTLLPLAFIAGVRVFRSIVVTNGFTTTALSASLGAACAAASLALARAGSPPN